MLFFIVKIEKTLLNHLTIKCDSNLSKEVEHLTSEQQIKEPITDEQTLDQLR